MLNPRKPLAQMATRVFYDFYMDDCCVTRFILGRCNMCVHLLNPGIGNLWSTKAQIQHPTWWTKFLLRLLYRSLGEWSLKEAEMTQRQLYHQSPPSMSNSSHTKSWEPGAHCTACRQLDRLKSVLSTWPSPRKLLEASWLASLRVFSAALLTETDPQRHLRSLLEGMAW